MSGAVVLLFAIASAVALATRKLRVPYTVALVLVGFALGRWADIKLPRLTHDLLFTLFLPGLLFEAAFHLSWRDFRRNVRTIFLLAVPGVVASIVLTALALLGVSHVLGLGIDARAAALFGAIVAATDPIAVVSVFRDLHVPRRLGVLVEGESLLNDGTGVVFFSIVLAMAAGRGVHLGAAAFEFLRVSGMGVLVGVLLGFALSVLTQRIDDAVLEIALTTLAAYGSFIVADYFGGSGVLATVAAGMVCGSFGAPRGMSETSRAAVESFWQFVAFALNSLVFLLLGTEVSAQGFVVHLPAAACALAAMLFARAAVTALVSLVVRRTTEGFDWKWSVTMTWAGLRGALSMVLALALPESLEQRDSLVGLTGGAVMLSIVLQGVTIAPLVRRLGLTSPTDRQ